MTGTWRTITSNLKWKRDETIKALKELLTININFMNKKKKEVTDPKEISEREASELMSAADLLIELEESTRVMELIKSQFGYSGYSNPNYISLEKQIEKNKKIIESLK